MNLLRCTLTLHDTVYYASREMGTLYETERYFHNFALAYALLGEHTRFADLITQPFFCGSYQPTYAQDLAKLNEQGIYISPAQPLNCDYVLVTWKIGQTTYYRKTEQFQGRNYPANIGRAKELAPGSTFECYVLSPQVLDLPRWIRLGKWHSKAHITVEPIRVQERAGDFQAACALNPLDVPAGMLRTFDIVSMPPSSLITHAQLSGPYYAIGDRGLGLPIGMRYTLPALGAPQLRRGLSER